MTSPKTIRYTPESMGRPRVCDYSRRLQCRIRKKLCPLKDIAFLRLGEAYLFKNRTLKSPYWLSHSGNLSDLFQMEKVADLGLIFKSYRAIERYIQYGEIKKWSCKALRDARKTYLDRKDGEKIRRLQEEYEDLKAIDERQQPSRREKLD